MSGIDGVVRPDKLRTALISFGLAAGAVAFVWVGTSSGVRRGPAMLFVGAALFAVGAVSVASNLIPGATELRSAGAHLEMRRWFRASAVPWSACGPFTVVRVGSQRHVAFDLAPPHGPTGLIGALNAALVGRNAFIDLDYPADDLCAVLNAWRDEALSG